MKNWCDLVFHLEDSSKQQSQNLSDLVFNYNETQNNNLNLVFCLHHTSQTPMLKMKVNFSMVFLMKN